MHDLLRRRWAGAALAAGCALTAGCNLGSNSREARASDEWTRSYQLAPGGEFQVVGAVGSIDLRSGAGTAVEVHAERVVRAATEAMARPMVERVQIREEVSPDKVLIRNEGLGGVVIGVDVEVNFRVTVPPGTRVRVRAAGGDISLADLDGPVIASTTNGAISASGLRGGVDARSTNGSITIDLAAVGRDPVDIRAVNGSVELRLPVSADANLDATVRNGAVDIEGLPLERTGEQSAQRLRGRLNNGGAPVELSTTNGDIHVRPRP